MKRFQELSGQAAAAFDLLLSATTVAKTTKKLTAQEFAEAIKTYTTFQVQSLVAKAIGQCYSPLKDQLACQLLEIGSCRLRIESAHPTLIAEADIPAAMCIPGELLPPGCRNPEDAAQMFVKTLNDHDLLEIDKRVQVGLEQSFGGLYEAGLNSTDGLKGMLRVIREQTRRYLDERLGEVDMAAMLAERFPGRAKVARAVLEAFEKALPRLISGGPWASKSMNVVATPTGAGGEAIQELAMETLPVGTILTDIRDEIYIHREYSELPLSALSQLGPAWSAAYRSAPEGLQVPPHCRNDVTQWTDVDSV